MASSIREWTKILPYVIFRLHHSRDDPNAGKEALICPFTGTVDCESCISDHCLPQCAANSLQTLKVAEGNEIKVSTVVGNPDEVFASDFAAFIMNKPLNALNIKGIKQIVENARTSGLVDLSRRHY